jgi:asparagine synthase (glutamine-hydrolysing)
MTYVDLNLRLPELLLMRIDKMSMGASVEARVPFLDHEFVSLVMSIPTAVKTRNGTPKYLLKKAVRGIVPDELIDRPKQGFGVPVEEWLTGRLGDRIRAELETFCSETDILDRTAVNEVLARPGGHDAWYLYNLAGWWREYVRD